MKKSPLQDLMLPSFESVGPDLSLRQIAGIMHRTKIDNLPVTDRTGKLIGVISKSSLLQAVSQGKSHETRVRELMIQDPISVPEHMAYEDLSEKIRTATIGSAIVIDDTEKVKGVITKTSYMNFMFKKETFFSNQLNAILQTMYNGLVTIDPWKKITRINRAGEKILNQTNQNLKGTLIRDLLPGLDLDRVLILGTSMVGIEYFHHNLTLVCNITPIEENNQITGCVIVFQDLTDLIRTVSELESVTKLYGTLKLVMDNAYDGIVVVDEKSCISLINRSAANFFRKKQAAVLNQPVEALVKDSRVREVVKTGVPVNNQLQFIQGTPYVVSILPILNKGQVIGAVFKILFRHLDEVMELAEKLDNADQQLAYYRDKAEEKEEDHFNFDQIVTADPAFNKLKEESEIAARGASNILITGESGTGKELIAQAIHYASPFFKGPLVKINCAAIPENLLEAEFFGYAPGAFSGARKQGNQGKLLSAQGGSVFLDEIGDMSLHLQSKLLRVLQDKKFEPVGSTKTVKVHVRIIAATNQNLEHLVEEGRFRADLYYRLNVVSFHIPPLRERRYDINLLVHFFLEKYNRIFGTNIRGISAEARDILLTHDWPGNVRELENVIERVINFARGDIIESDTFPLYLREKRGLPLDPVCARKMVLPKKLRDKRHDYEIEAILAAIEKTGGNKAKASKLLGISRSWLYEKLARAGMNA